MIRMRINIAQLQKMKRVCNKSREIKNIGYYGSQERKKHKSEVAAINEKIEEIVADIKRLDDIILGRKLVLGKKILSVYMPQAGLKEYNKKEF